MFDQQMELGLNRNNECPSANRRQRRHSRASWWFAQMRQVVDQAMDWPAAPAPRPEQIWFGSAYRQPLAAGSAPRPNPADERQICE